MILIDTSGLIAALFDNQRHHEACARALREATPPRVVSPFVLAEVDYLILKYGSVDAELLFLEEIGRRAYMLAPFDESDVASAQTIVAKYRNLNIGLADASIVELAARYNCRDLLTLDHRHFRAMRPFGRKTFRILPEDGG